MLRRHFIINTESSIPNNEIWYTSSDGNIVTPSDKSTLPTIVSNRYYDGKGIIKFETDITSIGRNAFIGNNRITSITIPNSVTSIRINALHTCTKLTSITYTGTIFQWNAITKETNWHIAVPATVVHCTDGDVSL